MKRAVLALIALLSGALPALAREGDPPESIYHLEASLTNQAGQTQHLDVHRGHPVLITMFYASCPAVCPMIVDTLRATERELTPAERANLRVLLVSIDPERDTAQALAELANSRRIDTSRWTLARADEATVRNIAALLNIQYRKLPSGEFNHSTVITLLSASGEIVASTSKLGSADPALREKLQQQ